MSQLVQITKSLYHLSTLGAGPAPPPSLCWYVDARLAEIHKVDFNELYLALFSWGTLTCTTATCSP